MPNFTDPTFLINAAFWLIMWVIASYVLIRVNALFIDDFPTNFTRTMGLVLVTAGIMFFAFDLSAYFFAKLMQDPDVGIRMPPGYGYLEWLREPLALKWRVLGLFPFVRYIPVGIAVIMGSILQIFVWRITFPLGFLILIVQLMFDLVALAALSFAFSVGINMYIKEKAEDKREAAVEHRHDPHAEPKDLADVERGVGHAKEAAATLWHKLDKQWESVNGHLAPLYKKLQPVTDHFPPPAQDWLNAGGWVAVPFGLVALVMIGRRFRRDRPKYRRRGVS